MMLLRDAPRTAGVWRCERGGADWPEALDALRDPPRALWLRGDARVRWFRAECEADESIHLHNAYAAQEEGEAPPLR